MYEQEWWDDRMRDLVLLTEHPGSRLLQRDVATLTPQERHARTIIRLLAMLDAGHCGEALDETLPRYAAADIDDDDAIERALLAIGAHTFRRQLALYRRFAARLAFDPGNKRARRRLDRIICNRYGETDALEHLLWLHVHAHRGAFAALSTPWPKAARQRSTDVHDAPADRGALHIAVMQDDDATARLIEAWIARTGLAMLHDERRSTTITDFVSMRKSFKDPYGSVPPRAVLGCTLPGQSAYVLPRDGLSSDDAVLRAVAAHYRWALIVLPNTMHEHPLAWISADGALADEFSALVRQRRHPLLCSYRHIDSFAANAHGTQFGENDGYGDAALVAAEADGCPPLLIIAVDGSSGLWWMPCAAKLPCAALTHVNRGRRHTLAAYRADDVAAYRTLWSRLDTDRNVAIAAVSGLADPAAALNAVSEIDGVCTFAHIGTLSQRCRWAYMHVWGGGSDEHHAMFQARDPRITARVHAYAAQQTPERGYLSGRW